MTLLSMVRCAEREERMRREFYPRRVERGQMTQETMDHEISCMAQIAARLRAELARETGALAPSELEQIRMQEAYNRRHD